MRCCLLRYLRSWLPPRASSRGLRWERRADAGPPGGCQSECQPAEHTPLRTSTHLPATISCPANPQLTQTPGNPHGPWSAAAWAGPTRGLDNAWTDGGAGTIQLSNVPWCPNEPNDRNGVEGCTSILTHCTPDGTAAVNDIDCDKPLRVMCAVPSSTTCGECSDLTWHLPHSAYAAQALDQQPAWRYRATGSLDRAPNGCSGQCKTITCVQAPLHHKSGHHKSGARPGDYSTWATVTWRVSQGHSLAWLQ
jgi:hypothetical protein